MADRYTIDQCCELRQSQTIFLPYLMIRLIRNEAHLEENQLQKILENLNENNQISKFVIQQGFLTIEQILHSARAFFLNEVD